MHPRLAKADRGEFAGGRWPLSLSQELSHAFFRNPTASSSY
jgi:hypothetical protein